MKQVNIYILFTVALLISATYFVMYTSNSESTYLEGEITDQKDCLRSFTKVTGTRPFLKYSVWVQNTCYQPLQFSITFTKIGDTGPILDQLKTNCLSHLAEQYTTMNNGFSEIKNVIVYPC